MATMIHYRELKPRLIPRAMLPILASGVISLYLPTDQAAAAQIQPNALKFGSVRVGATVEGSVRIFRETANSSGLAIKVEPPAFVRVEDMKVGSQDFGGDIRGFCDVTLSIDTERAGDYSGEVRVEIGRDRFAIPVSVTVRPQMPNLTRVLVVETPFDKFSTADATRFNPWLDLLTAGHFDVHYLASHRGMPVLRKIDLAKIDVVLLGMEGLLGLQDSDIKSLKDFMNGGGRTILAANAFFVGTVAKANELLVPNGLRMQDTETRGHREFDLGAADITDHALTEGVKTLYFHRPSPVEVTDKLRGKVLVAAPGYAGAGFVAVARAGQGEVIALGESLWWNWLAGDKPANSDNAVFLSNLLKKPQRRK
jgi:hypothetical protein